MIESIVHSIDENRRSVSVDDSNIDEGVLVILDSGQESVLLSIFYKKDEGF